MIRISKVRLTSGISAIAISAALTFSSPAEAQTTSGIQGHAGPGSTVTFTDVNTGHTDTARADGNGNYLIVGLPPSTYRVQSGSASQTVVVPLGQTVTADLTPAAVAATGAIVVVGARSKDVKTPTVQTNVSQFQIQNLPNGDRNFLNFAALAPGVTVSPPQLGGNARQVQAGAINSDNTNTFIDGLSIKNLVNHGGTLGQNYSSGNPFPESAVDQFNVDTQNFKAEFGDSASAVISSVTKTGGDQFHGEIFGEYQPDAWISQNYFDRPGHINNPTAPYRPKPHFKNEYYGGDLGGPIIKDKLTFFVDFEGTNKTFGSNDIEVYPGNVVTLLPPAEQAYAQSARTKYDGSFPETFKEQLYFGKLTYFATPADTINVSAFIRHENNLSIPSGVTTKDASTFNRNNEDRYEAWWNHRGTNWLNEFWIARDAAANGAVPATAGPGYDVVYNGGNPLTVNSNPEIILGGTNFTQDDHQYQTLVKDNVTITAGSHTIKVGGSIDFLKLQRLEDRNGSGTFYYDAAGFTGIGSEAPFAATINTGNPQPVTVKDKQIALFAQDDWRPNDHWLVSYGLRWDYETNATNENFVTPAGIAAALRAYPGWPAAGINPEDYISNGHNRHPFKGEFQPRLGVSYDVNGDRDLVFIAGAGRYYDRSLFIDSALETVKDEYESIVPLYTCGPNAPNPATCINGPLPMTAAGLRALAAGQKGEVHLLNNHTKIPYSDEVELGIRKRFGKVNTAIIVSYIKSHNIYQEVVGNRYPNGTYNAGGPPIYTFNGVTYADGIFFCPEAAICGAPLPGYGSIFIGNSDGKANYKAVYLTADKPYTPVDHYGFTAALTISSARSNDPRDTNQIGDPVMFDEPQIGQQGWGPVVGLERWRFVGTGTVGLPWDIRLSTVVTLSSGASYPGVLCGVPSTAPGGGGCYLTNFGIYRPHGIGYKNVDINVSKSFKPFGGDKELTVYFQALNVFDFVNRNYSEWQGGFATTTMPASQKPDIGSVASQGRNFKIGARFTF